jgi:phosphatidylserine synthase
MNTAPYKVSDVRGTLASVEGYLALALVILPFLAPSVDHPSNDMAVVGAVWAGIAFGLAVGGVRFGKGRGRLAAQVALVALSLWLLVVLIASIVRWEQVLWYWHH